MRETKRKQSFRRIKLAMVWKRDWKWGDQLGDFPQKNSMTLKAMAVGRLCMPFGLRCVLFG